MEVHSDWYDRIVREISAYKDSLSKKDYKKYKLDLLLRLAGRVESFSSACGECQMFRQEISELTQGLGNLVQIPDKDRRKSYLKAINNIIQQSRLE